MMLFNPNIAVKKIDQFDGLDELLNHIDQTPIQWSNPDKVSSISERENFCGTKTFKDAMNLMRYGWPEGLKDMSSTLKNITKIINPRMCQDNYLDVAGAYPHVPAACAGEINNMVNFTHNSVKQKPIIKLLVNTTTSGSTDKIQITNRGAAILSYVDILEQSGNPMEIELYDLGLAGNKLYCSRLIIKHAGQLLDIDRLAFCLSHPSYLRRIGFRLRELHADLQSSFQGGYGSMKDFDKEDLDKLNLGLHVHFPFLSGGYCNLKDSITAVKRTIISQITQQGYELPAVMQDEPQAAGDAA